MSKSRRRHEEHEEHVNHERWLVSYADMMTLLMVLFIVMFAISQVDQRKFDQLKDGMAAGFGATASPFQGSQGTLSGDGAKPLQPVGPDAAKPDVNVGMDSASQSSKSSAAAAAQGQAAKDSTDYQHAASEVTKLQALRKAIMKALAQHGYQRDVQIKIDEQGLTVSLVSRHIVFRANEAALSPRGEQVLDVLSPVIRSLPNHLDVDGHTNQVKVKPKYYPTDWELSAARAVTVLRYLNEHGRVPAIRMTAVAFGHERPLRDPALAGAAALNKRVDLVVVSDSPESTRRLFTQVLRDRHEST
jgi:chemotaxis protein MotB